MKKEGAVVFCFLFIILLINFSSSQTFVDSCRNITAGGYYALNASLASEGGGACIWIQTPHVILDLGSYIISNASNSDFGNGAIRVNSNWPNSVNVTILNGIINNNIRGISLSSGVRDVTLMNITIANISAEGVGVTDGLRINISNNRFLSNSPGIRIYTYGQHFTIDGNVFSQNSQNHITSFFAPLEDSNITRNVFLSMPGLGTGISLTHGGRNRIVNNSFEDFSTGIMFHNSSSNSIVNNTFEDLDLGVSLNDSNAVDLGLNLIYSSSAGLYALNSHNLSISSNLFLASSNSSIFLGSSSNSSLTENVFNTTSSSYAIRLLSESNLNSFTGNIIQGENLIWNEGINYFNDSSTGNAYLFSNGSSVSTLFDLWTNLASGWATGVVGLPFNMTGLGEDLWNGSGEDWHPHTANFDNEAPQVSFSGPTNEDGSTLSTSNIEVNLSVIEDNFHIARIFLYGPSGELVDYEEFTDEPFYKKFSDLSEGVYYFNATAYDLAGNGNSTETMSVTISAEVSQAPSQVSSSSGVYIPQSYVSKQEDFFEGYNKLMYRGDKISFESGGQNHSITLLSYNFTSAKVTIASTPKNFTLEKDEENYVDLDEDGNTDLILKYEGRIGSKAKLFVKGTILEDGPSVTGVSEEEGVAHDAIDEGTRRGAAPIILIIAILLISLVVYFGVKVFGKRRN